LPLILSTHPLHPEAAALLERAGELRIAPATDAATLNNEAEAADIIIVRAPLPPTIYDRGHRLRAAIRHGAGLDMIPIPEATAAGVLVANVPGANAVTVAEHVIFTAIALLRRFRMVDRDLRTAGWNVAREHSYVLSDLTGLKLGIIGMGNLGHAIFRIAHGGFGMDVIANSRRRESLPAGARFASLDDLVAEADIVVLCCPLTPQTTGLMNRERIARMKPGALVINVARGPVIDEGALVDALREGRVGGAALDVFSTQPLPPDHPFFSFGNVILTPHMAGITRDSMKRMGTGAAAEAVRVLEGRLPVNLCNPDAVPRYRERFQKR
jgi:D-3-phosphoglycerate dehydrogenase